MGIINRSLDLSEQQEQHTLNQAPTVTAGVYTVANIRRPMKLNSAEAKCLGLSGAPTSQLAIQRYIAAAGVTNITVGAALTHVDIGSIGVQTFSLPAVGSSLLQLQDGDSLVVVAGGANSALNSLVVDVVLENLQDIKSW